MAGITPLIRDITFDYLNVCDHNPPTLEADRWTDRQTEGETSDTP